MNVSVIIGFMIRKAFITFIIALAFALNVSATVHYVVNLNDTDVGSLRQVIADADTNDTVKLDTSLLSAGSDSIRLFSPISILKSLRVVGVFNSTDTIYISGRDSNRIFTVGFGAIVPEHIAFDSLVLIRGGISSSGGAIRASSDTLVVRNCILRRCTLPTNGGSSSGGGISHTGDYCEISNTLFKQCEAEFGGGLFIYAAEAKVTNCRFIECFASLQGGGLYRAGNSTFTLNLTDTRFEKNNSDDHGAGISISGNPLQITLSDSCLFIDNDAGDDGGAMFIHGFKNVDLNLSESRFSNNTNFGNGSGLYLEADSIINLDAEFNSFYGNDPSQEGSGMYLISEQLNINLSDSKFGGNDGNVLYIWAKPQSAFLGGPYTIDANLSRIDFKHNTIANNSPCISLLASENSSPERISFTVDSCLFEGNNGGLDIVGGDSIVTIVNGSRFIENEQSNPISQYSGGAVFSSLEIVNSRFNNNDHFEPGGGVLLEVLGPSPNINDSLNLVLDIANTSFINNEAEDEGGAISVQIDGDFSNAINEDPLVSIIMDSVLVQGNEAGDNGGAISFFTEASSAKWAFDFNRVEIRENRSDAGNPEAVYFGTTSSCDSVYINGTIDSMIVDSNTNANNSITTGWKVSKNFFSTGTADMTISNSTFVRQTEAFDIFGYTGDLNLIRCSFLDNTTAVESELNVHASDSCYFKNQSSFTVYGSTVTCNSCHFENNERGISADTAYIDSSLFEGQQLEALYRISILEATNTTFRNNAGGAILMDGTNLLTLDQCEFEGNSNSLGGAIETIGFSPDYNWTIDRSTFYNNQGSSGGVIGVVGFPGSININRSTFYQNIATGFGGAIYISNNSTLSIHNSTFHQNSGLSGNSIYANLLDTLWIGGSILSIDSGDNLFVNQVDTIISNGYNLCSDSSFSAHLMDLVNIPDSFTGLDTLNYNGGFTRTLLPAPNSVAINTGNPSEIIPAQNGPITNIRDRGAAESESCGLVDHLNIVACDSFYYAQDDTMFYSSLSLFDTLATVPCDTVTWLELQINQSDFSYTTAQECLDYYWSISDSIYTSSGLYSYIDSSGNGCPTIYELDLIVNQPDTAQTQVSDCLPYLWNVNGQTYDSSGIYLDTNLNECSIEELVLTINIVEAIIYQDSIPILYSDSGYDSYAWLGCLGNQYQFTGSTDSIFFAQTSGLYALVVTENGCSDTSDCIEVITGGLKQPDNSILTIYPNPLTNNQFTLKLNGKIGLMPQDFNVNLVSITGETSIYLGHYSDVMNKILVPDYIANGAYLLQIKGLKNEYIEKLYISR